MMETIKDCPECLETSAVAPQKRIHAIDALRGITLLGILLVHTSNLFGYGQPDLYDGFSSFGNFLVKEIYLLLDSRCALVFNILFGISFYLILKNPDYSGWKFAWRCVLLIGIGLLNKVFYTYDALMWYGLWGIALLTIRNYPPRWILAIAIITFLLPGFIRKFSLGNMLFEPSERYVVGAHLSDIVSYPLKDAVCAYLKIVLNGGILGTFSYMAFGYWAAKKQLMNNIKAWATPKTVLVLLVAYIAFFEVRTHTFTLKRVAFTTGAMFMATLFLYIYGKFPRGMKYLEAYGRMGLTNYSFQGIIGVCSLTLFLLPQKLDFGYILIYFILVYIAQCIFSYYWLKYFKYGPMEYLWRSLVNFRFSNPLKDKIFIK